MTLTQLASRVEKLDPEADFREVARTCLLLANSVDSIEELENDEHLLDCWQEAGLKLQLATDQHAATTLELEELASSDPKQFRPEQIWVLLRAIKVQGQVLQLYVGGEAIDV